MITYLALFALFVILGLFIWIGRLNSRIAQLAAQARQARTEQEAVLTLIDKLGEKITQKIDLDDILQILTEYLVQATRAESGAVYLVLEGERALQARVVRGQFPRLHEPPDPLPGRLKTPAGGIREDKIRFGDGIIGLVAEQGDPVLITDAEADPRVPHRAAASGRVHSLLLCPLRVRGQVLGVLVVANKRGGGVFDSRDLALLQSLGDQAAVTVDLVKLYDVLARQQRLEQELRVAREFQRMLLPREFPDLPGFEFFGASEAATVVGGDYFDIFPVDESHWGMVIADVSGKGIPGALIMATVRAVLRAEAHGCLSPRQVLGRVNERVRLDTKDTVFITLTYGILDVRTGDLRFVRAGHEPLMVLGPGREVDQYKPDGIALGMVGEALFDCLEEAQVRLAPGGIALLYTDGVVEAMDRRGEEYGRDRLIGRLESMRGLAAKDLIKAVIEDINQFTLGLPQNDDITLLALRATEPPVASEVSERAIV